MPEANELFDSIEKYKCKDFAEKLDKSMHPIAEFKELNVPDWHYNQYMSVFQQVLLSFHDSLRVMKDQRYLAYIEVTFGYPSVSLLLALR